MQNFKPILLILALVGGILSAYAQDSTPSWPLKDLSDFRPQAGNWLIVGDVTMNPDVDIHEKQEVIAPVVSKKNKKSSTPLVDQKPYPVTYQPGTGILLNMNDDVKKSQLLTIFEHSDIELELEVMLPKGSNSGIFVFMAVNWDRFSP